MTHPAVICHRCEKKCSNTKACGRHQCRRRCCDGDCPPCDLPCGRRLRCGNHKCPAPCHSGPCLPCPLTSTVACACGKTRYSLPCGSEAKAVPPHCRELCPVPATCRHAEARPLHRCAETAYTRNMLDNRLFVVSGTLHVRSTFAVVMQVPLGSMSPLQPVLRHPPPLWPCLLQCQLPRQTAPCHPPLCPAPAACLCHLYSYQARAAGRC